MANYNPYYTYNKYSNILQPTANGLNINPTIPGAGSNMPDLNAFHLKNWAGYKNSPKATPKVTPKAAPKQTLKQVVTKGVDSVDDWVKGTLNSWDPNTGWGGKYAKGANTLAAIGQGVQAIGGLSQNVKQGNIIDDLEGQILAAYGSNPLANSMLSSDQLTQIRRLKNGYSDNDPSFNDVIGGIGQDLPSILMNTAMGAASGGIPGALISGIGSLVNSGISGFGQGQAKQASELESLYNALLNAEQQYKGMVMPSSQGIPLRAPYNTMYL